MTQQGPVSESAKAAGEFAKLGRSAPRFAIAVFGSVFALAVVLGFILLWSRVPKLDENGAAKTTGNWVTPDDLKNRDDTLKREFEERAQQLATTTRESVASIRTTADALRMSFEGLRSVIETNDKSARDRFQVLTESVLRMEAREADLGRRIDRLFETLPK